MKVRKWMSTAAVMAALIGMSAVMPAPAEAACKKFRTGRAVGSIELFTKARARSAWRSDVLRRDGRAFASWVRAIDKTEKCDKSGPGSQWRCRATAKPCSKS